MTDNLFAALAGMVDQSQLAYVVEEEKNSINRARLIQGDPSFEKDPNFNQTVHYLGGIGLSIENLPEEVLSKGTIKKTDNGEWCTFPALDVVILATSRYKRHYGEIDGKKNQLLCGTNQDGFHSVGWSGLECKECPYHKKNWLAAGNDKEGACKSFLGALIYIPSLDHVAIFSAGGSSYMEAAGWFDQTSLLSKALAKKPEFQAVNPGLARVNPYYFKTTLKASPYKKNESNQTFQILEYSKAEQPFDWGKMLNTPEAIKRSGELMNDLREVWEQMYVSPNTSAAFYGKALPAGQAAAALPAQSGAQKVSVPAAPVAATELLASTINALPEELGLMQQPAAPVQAPQLAPAQPAVQTIETPALPVSTVSLDDVDEVPPIGQVMTF